MLKIGILGIGNAGNQVADLASRSKFDVFCINTSERDLDNINRETFAYLLGDAEGAGKDRTIAKNFVKREYRALLQCEPFTKFMDKKDTIFIVSSSGGGTGSGVSIILSDILARVYPNKLFINIGILPTLNDSIGAQRNTLEFLKELKGMNKSYMLYDNNKYTKLTPDECMTKVNKDIIDALCYIRGDFSQSTRYGMIDDADTHKLLTVPGMISFAYANGFFEKDMEDDEMLDDKLLVEFKNNSTCIGDKDRIVKRIGIWVALSKEMRKYYSPAMTKLCSAVGEPVEMFNHNFYYEDESYSGNMVAALLAGRSIPDDRINIIIQRIQEVEAALSKTKESSLIDQVGCLDAFKVGSLGVDKTRSDEKKDINAIDFSFLDDNY